MRGALFRRWENTAMDPESSDVGNGRNESYRPLEQPAVVTTIVGGRPPSAGQPIGTVPRGIEVLVRKPPWMRNSAWCCSTNQRTPVRILSRPCAE